MMHAKRKSIIERVEKTVRLIDPALARTWDESAVAALLVQSWRQMTLAEGLSLAREIAARLASNNTGGAK